MQLRGGKEQLVCCKHHPSEFGDWLSHRLHLKGLALEMEPTATCVVVHAQCCSPGHHKAFTAEAFYLLTEEERQIEHLLECISLQGFFFFS